MKMIIGLGNPGQKYEKTRHNTGFLVLEELKAKMINNPFSNVQGKQSSIIKQSSTSNFQYQKKLGAEVAKVDNVMLVKPQLFMNRSGEVIRKITDYFSEKHEARSTKHENLYIVHDDLDIQLGEYKVQFGRGPKMHNGVNSVREALGTDQFWYVRVGIENRLQLTVNSEQKISGEEYVLKPFLPDERAIINQAVEKVVSDLYGRIV